MNAALTIVIYAAILLIVSGAAAKIAKRSFVPAANVLQPDGTYNYLPAHTITVFVLVSLWLIWVANYYSPPPPLSDLIAQALSDTGWLMLGLLLLIRKENFRVVGFEGRKQVLYGGLSFLAVGTLLANRAVIFHFT